MLAWNGPIQKKITDQGVKHSGQIHSGAREDINDLALFRMIEQEQDMALNKLRFILPCKSDCHPIFGILQFVTQFTHV